MMRDNKMQVRKDILEPNDFMLKPYLPIFGIHDNLDAIVLSYLTASNLELTLKSMPPTSKNSYNKMDVIRAKYGVTLKEAKKEKPSAEQLETIKQHLNE